MAECQKYQTRVVISSQDSEAVFRKLIARGRCLRLLEVTSKMRIAGTEGTPDITRDALAECVKRSWEYLLVLFAMGVSRSILILHGLNLSTLNFSGCSLVSQQLHRSGSVLLMSRYFFTLCVVVVFFWVLDCSSAFSSGLFCFVADEAV